MHMLVELVYHISLNKARMLFPSHLELKQEDFQSRPDVYFYLATGICLHYKN